MEWDKAGATNGKWLQGTLANLAYIWPKEWTALCKRKRPKELVQKLGFKKLNWELTLWKPTATDVAHLRKYLKTCDVFHQVYRLADSNNMCQSHCWNVRTHAKGLRGLASRQTKADWNRQTESTHTQRTVQRVAIFLFLSFYSMPLTWLNFPFHPYYKSISFSTFLIPISPSCTFHSLSVNVSIFY